MTSERNDLKDELRAVVNARQELSKDEEQFLVEHFLERLDADIDARIDAKVAQIRPAKQSKGGNDGWVIPAALGIAIPLSAIAAAGAGFIGLLVCWIGIVTVLAVYLGTRN